MRNKYCYYTYSHIIRNTLHVKKNIYCHYTLSYIMKNK